MRTLKFRAWDTDIKQMLTPVDISKSKKYFMWLGEKDLQIMQFTGLLDKNGKEIYEGDIISNYGGCIIEWRDYKYDFKYKHPDFSSKQWMGGMDSHFCRNELEVIGNQYENINLLIK